MRHTKTSLFLLVSVLQIFKTHPAALDATLALTNQPAHPFILKKHPNIICELCEQKCASQSALEVHLRTHSGEKLFKCTECNKHFSRKSHLKVHIRIHTGEKPFTCDTCNKTFSQKSNLKTHAKTHFPTEKKIVSCPGCHKELSGPRGLKEHLKKNSCPDKARALSLLNATTPKVIPPSLSPETFSHHPLQSPSTAAAPTLTEDYSRLVKTAEVFTLSCPQTPLHPLAMHTASAYSATAHPTLLERPAFGNTTVPYGPLSLEAYNSYQNGRDSTDMGNTQPYASQYLTGFH